MKPDFSLLVDCKDSSLPGAAQLGDIEYTRWTRFTRARLKAYYRPFGLLGTLYAVLLSRA